MKYAHIGVPIFELQMEQQLLCAENHMARRLIGSTQIQLKEALDPTEAIALETLAKRVLRTGLTLSVERTLRWRTANFDQGLFEISLSAIPKADTVTVTLIDQSDWVEQRHSASHFTHFLKRLLDLTSTLFFVLDRDYQVVFANEAFHQHFGIQQTQSLGINNSLFKLSRQTTFGLEEHLFDVIGECLHSGTTQSTQVLWPDQKHVPKVFQMLLQPLKSADQTIEQVLILGSDITALVNAHKEQEQLQQALNEAQRLDAIGQMAGTIAHDFNGFLTVIMASISLLELDIEDKEQKSLLDGVIEVCDQARQLTRDLLAYSRSQVSPTERGSVQKLLAHLGFALPRLGRGQNKVNWHVLAYQEEREIELSEAQCSQIIVNLVNNAIEAIPNDRQGKIDVHCTMTEDELTIQVQDNGQGIALELMNSIFEPFFTTKKSQGGTGLGLASARSLVRKVNGELLVQSEVGVGTKFIVKLPIFCIANPKIE